MRFRLLASLLLLSFTLFSFQDTTSQSKDQLEKYFPFIDSLVLDEMKEYHVPGAVVSMVIDSSEIFFRGYGLADIENEINVDGSRTGFRVASITKTFTATAAMQLVDQGKLDLHKNIIEYLPPYDYNFLDKGPITMHHLLTHTAGFEMTDINDAARIPDDVISIEEVVKHYMPNVAHPPGKVYCYSNFGFTLAGFVIEQIAGIPFVEYIRQNILDPINMNFSGLDQPLKNPMKNHEALSYLWNDRQIRYTRDYSNVVPADALVTTAKDMGNYMLMHLNNGKFNGKQIISEPMHSKMSSQQYGGKGTEFGIGYSFFEGKWIGRRTLEHSGGQLGFASVMILIPEIGAGIFIAHNSREGAGNFRYDIIRQVLDSLYIFKQSELTELDVVNDLKVNFDKYKGMYRRMDYPNSSYEKLGMFFGLIGSEWKVGSENDSLVVLGNKFKPIAEDVFQNINNPNWRVSFDLDNYIGSYKMTSGLPSYEKIPWFKRKRVLQIILGTGLLFLLIMFLARPIRWLIRKIKKKPRPYERSWIYEWLYYTGSSFIISFLVILINFMIYEGQVSDYGVPFSIKSSLALNVLAGLSSIFSVFVFVKVLTSNRYSKKRKVFYLIGIVSVVVVAIGYWYLNLIGF